MTDALFNTLLAVMSMCQMHGLHGEPNGYGGWEGTRWIQFEKGYEQCVEVQKAVDDENARRSKINTDEKMKNEKWQLANALAGLHGKPFKEEAKPEPPKSNLNCWTINTETGNTVITP
jgi:hypothetical protein